MKRHPRLIIIALLLLVIAFKSPAQGRVFKRFVIKDTTGINKDAVLILYDNQSFINFGIINNKAENDAYVWYAAGKWNMTDSSLSLNPQYDLFDTEFLKKDIKAYYKKRSDYRLIESYYEFVKEFYKERRLQLLNVDLTDRKKLINYTEVGS